MDISMLDMAVKAAAIILDPNRLMFLALGVFMGLIVGVIPGIGGLVGLSLLLPFTFDMDPYAALAVMMGLLAVTTTSDTIPAVLFGVPGTVGSAATILDGYPMARRGEAGRALGAGFAASLLGGLFGALLLAVSIPVLRPVVLMIASPELLAICVFGLSLVAVLSGGAVRKGLAAAAIGLLIATTGDDVNTGTLRWTFGALYLWDGIPIVPVALGLFALPELADLVISGKSIAGDAKVDHRAGQWQGIKDVMANKFLVLRCAFIGSGLGSIPGIGASVIDWIAYGHAARSERDTSGFGSGDVRGVIASESSNNAKEGGSLVPTIAFGVPGSASMAVMLGAFMIHDIVPGPDMLTKRLDFTYTLVWSVAIANVLGAGVCFLAANQLARIARIRIGILAPVVLSVVFIGAYQASRDWGDFYVMFGFGALGWVMKRVGWPRPPLILGFVLGALIENYMFISVQRYGWDWLSRPFVIAVFAMTAYGILHPVLRGMRGRDRRRTGVPRPRLGGFPAEAVFTVAVITFFASAFVLSAEWEFGAKLVPRVICGIGILFASALLVSQVLRIDAPPPTGSPEGPRILDITEDFEGLARGDVRSRAAIFAAWCLGMLGLAALIGLLPSILVFLVAYMRWRGRETWRVALTVSLPIWILCWVLFHEVLEVHWPHSVLGAAFPGLRAALGVF